jgi:hypothetical protein
MLVFLGLWTQASRNGVFPWKPRTLKLDILPFLDFRMEDTLEILWRGGYIQRFEADGAEYGFIPTLVEHQAFSHKEMQAPPRYPDFNPENFIRVPGTDQELPQPTPGSVPEQTRNSPGTVPAPADIGHRTKDIGHRTTEGASEILGSDTFREPPLKTAPSMTAERALIDPICQAFEYFNPKGFTDTGAENIGAIGLAAKFARLGGEDPGNLALAVIEQYARMVTAGRDKFWRTQPLTPSNLNKPGIFDRVMAEIRNQRGTFEDIAAEWGKNERKTAMIAEGA